MDVDFRLLQACGAWRGRSRLMLNSEQKISSTPTPTIVSDNVAILFYLETGRYEYGGKRKSVTVDVVLVLMCRSRPALLPLVPTIMYWKHGISVYDCGSLRRFWDHRQRE